MDQNNQNPVDVTGAVAHKKIGPIVVGLVVVLVLVIVALYIFASKMTTDTSSDQLPIDQPPVVQNIQPITNTADDPQSLVNDLNSTVQGLDAQTF
jgi:flagellar basal body-associated protein FliL